MTATGPCSATQAAEPLRIDAIGAGSGLIGMSICPGRRINGLYGIGPDRDLDDDLDAIRDWGAVAVVSLIESVEFGWYGVEGLRDGTLRRGMQHLHLPIEDMDVPDATFERDWLNEGARLRTLLDSGARVLLHCLAGMGRTGTIAARLLVEFGADPESAILTVRGARPGTIQTELQEEYVRRCIPAVRG